MLAQKPEDARVDGGPLRSRESVGGVANGHHVRVATGGFERGGEVDALFVRDGVVVFALHGEDRRQALADVGERGEARGQIQAAGLIGEPLNGETMAMRAVEQIGDSVSVDDGRDEEAGITLVCLSAVFGGTTGLLGQIPDLPHAFRYRAGRNPAPRFTAPKSARSLNSPCLASAQARSCQ